MELNTIIHIISSVVLILYSCVCVLLVINTIHTDVIPTNTDICEVKGIDARLANVTQTVIGVCKDGTEIPLPDGRIKQLLTVIKLALQGTVIVDRYIDEQITIYRD